jgi:hypothetical protein
MAEREVTVEEVLWVLSDPTEFEQADALGLIHHYAWIAGRQIRVTVDALSGTIVTVVAPPLKSALSPYGWFSFGASLEARQ